ncbi:MAG: hypothetical protein LBP73_08310 [Clostridiales Family XIII bacterium]|nr:hypothetical protein [Clostridiales Family XIII bacterium]
MVVPVEIVLKRDQGFSRQSVIRIKRVVQDEFKGRHGILMPFLIVHLPKDAVDQLAVKYADLVFVRKNELIQFAKDRIIIFCGVPVANCGELIVRFGHPFGRAQKNLCSVKTESYPLFVQIIPIYRLQKKTAVGCFCDERVFPDKPLDQNHRIVDIENGCRHLRGNAVQQRQLEQKLFDLLIVVAEEKRFQQLKNHGFRILFGLVRNLFGNRKHCGKPSCGAFKDQIDGSRMALSQQHLEHNADFLFRIEQIAHADLRATTFEIEILDVQLRSFCADHDQMQPRELLADQHIQKTVDHRILNGRIRIEDHNHILFGIDLRDVLCHFKELQVLGRKSKF